MTHTVTVQGWVTNPGQTCLPRVSVQDRMMHHHFQQTVPGRCARLQLAPTDAHAVTGLGRPSVCVKLVKRNRGETTPQQC